MSNNVSTKELRDRLIAAKTEAEGLLKVFEDISKTISNTGNEMKKAFKGLDLSKSEDIAKLNTLLEQSNLLSKQKTETTKKQNQVRKEKLALDKQIKDATDENVKGQIRLANARKRQKDILKDEVILADQSAGTLQKLAAQNRQLRREREALNLETDKGRQRLKEINKQLDLNNKRIEDNSDKLKKQRLNVGNYSSSVKDAINQSGLFSRQLSMIARVQATLNALTKKNVKQQEASAAATKASSQATTGLARGLRILKIALISTGIGAIVVALGSLAAAFFSTQRGADALTSVLRPLKAVFQIFVGFLQKTAFRALDALKKAFEDPKQAVIDLGVAIRDGLINRFIGFVNLFKSGGSIIANSFRILGAKIKLALKDVPIIGKAIDVKQTTKDLRKAQEELTTGFKEFGNAAIQATTGIENGIEKINDEAKDLAESVKESIAQGQKLDNLIKKFERRQIDLVIPLAKARLEFQKLREIAQDQGKTDEERIEALRKAEKQQRFIAKSEGELLDLKIKRLELEQSFNDTSREEELELQRLKAEKLRFEEQAQKKINGLVSLRTGIELRADKRRKKALEDTNKFIKELEDRFEQDEFIKRIEKANEKFQEELGKIRENDLISAEKKAELELKLRDELARNLLKIEDDRRQKEQEKLEESLEKEIKTKRDALKQVELDAINSGKTQEEIDGLLLKKKIELLKEEIRLRKKAGQETIDLQLELAKLQNKLSEQAAKANEEIYNKSIELLESRVDKFFEKRKEGIESELNDVKDAQDRIRKGIKEGNKDAEKSLAEEERRESELKAKQEEEAKKQLKVEASIALLKAYGESGGDVGKLFADVKTIEALVDTLSFFDGTDKTPDKVLFPDKHGGVTGFVHANEQVWSNKDLKETGNRTREQSKDIIKAYDRGLLTDTTFSIVGSDNSQLKSEMKRVADAIETLHTRMPKSSYNFENGYHEEVVKHHNKVETLRKKAKEKWA
jgi:hypothetical protein